MLRHKGLTEGRYVHRRGEALFGLAFGAILVWQGATLFADNALRVRLVHSLFRGTQIDAADISGRQRDATAAWLAGRKFWLHLGDARAAVSAWKSSPRSSAERLGIVARQEWWRGDESGAIRDVRMALEVQPTNEELTDFLAAWRTARSESGQLRIDTSEILARAPRNATALAHHAWCEHLDGRTAVASAELERAMAMEPANRVVLRRLSRFLIETGGDLSRSERLLLDGDRRWPDDDYFYYQLAQLYLHQKRYGEAEPYMARLAERRGHDASAREVVGLYWLERGDPGKAIQHFRVAVQLEPNEPRFRRRLDQAIAERRQTKR